MEAPAAQVVSAWRGAWLALDAQLWPERCAAHTVAPLSSLLTKQAERPAASAALGLGWGMVLFAVLGDAAADLAWSSRFVPWFPLSRLFTAVAGGLMLKDEAQAIRVAGGCQLQLLGRTRPRVLR